MSLVAGGVEEEVKEVEKEEGVSNNLPEYLYPGSNVSGAKNRLRTVRKHR